MSRVGQHLLCRRRSRPLLTGQRWSTWDDIGVLAGPKPWPDWVITADAAVDTELGILKTGKEVDVFLLERDTAERSCLLAAKRYRGVQPARRRRPARDHRRAAGRRHRGTVAQAW